MLTTWNPSWMHLPFYKCVNWGPGSYISCTFLELGNGGGNMKASFSLGPSPVSFPWCCAVLKAEISRTIDVPFLVPWELICLLEAKYAPAFKVWLCCPCLWNLLYLLRLIPTPPFSEFGYFMSSIPPRLDLIALSKRRTSCLCHKGLSRKAIQEAMPHVYASCVSPP